MRGDGDAGARVELHLPKCKSADSGGVRPRADSKTRQAVRGCGGRARTLVPDESLDQEGARDGSLPRAPGWAHRLSPAVLFAAALREVARWRGVLPLPPSAFRPPPARGS